MKDLPEGYEVQLQSEYVFAEDLYTIYNYAFTGYSGDEFADIHVPEEVNSIEMNYAGWQNFYGDFIYLLLLKVPILDGVVYNFMVSILLMKIIQNIVLMKMAC